MSNGKHNYGLDCVAVLLRVWFGNMGKNRDTVNESENSSLHRA